MTIRFDTAAVPPLPGELKGLLPEQGSFELQNDQAGKLHDWHRHDLDEELFVIAGDVRLFWDDGGRYQERQCASGTWITLPAGTVHGSLAGSDGAVYMIRPEKGRTARTTFLDAADHPFPSPRPATDRA
ncbi:hypothetical protein GCM10023085_02840 [Actinomadura viridis]|uniref:Quercetin dioxygenase-like cupin family protein n=1 Tax=Actinomadura viridis TaxID=58110 RepID=A0A931DQZ5_9ACTN|nr:hypothetical protein [Actinomadura viridis]MBG6091103.1 quercetin dioxygenase-like cupin family protein [Actinomadura viridis]